MKAFYALILVLLASTAYGQSNLPACQGSDASKWSNCFGSWTASDCDKYVGEWKDGKFNGQGVYIFINGNKYIGEFIVGNLQGLGILFYKDGRNPDSGMFQNGKLVQQIDINPNSLNRGSILKEELPKLAIPHSTAEINLLKKQLELLKKELEQRKESHHSVEEKRKLDSKKSELQ